MGFVGYLFFALKCFDLYAGPLFSLGYPLCASICAIESNSNSDTRKLIAYWVSYSLISLFEHAFMKLLEWLPFWPRMKLMIMFWLMIPHFSGALYFYELLVQPCLSSVPQIVINLFNEWKEPCLKRDDFPTEAAERYQKQNESEASEELISSDESKSIENNVGQKEDKDVEVIEENVEVTEENEDVEVIEENEDVVVKEKNEVAAIERVIPIESTIVQTGKSTETLTDMNVSSKSTPDFTEVQRKISLLQHQRNMNIHRQKKCESSNGLKEEVNIKQWDVHGLQINSEKIVQDTRSPLLCYICNVWCLSKDNLDAHRKGKKHLAQIQELADFVEVKEENEDVEVTEENEDVEVIEENEVAAIERVTPIESTLFQTGKSIETLTVEVTEENEDVEVTKENEVAAIERVTPIESTLVQIGKSTETLIVEVTEENEDVEVTEENEDVEATEKNEVVAIERVTPIESTLVQTGKSTETLTNMNVTSKSTPNFTEVQKEWACAICMVTIQSETTLNSHLQGRRHKANCEVLKAITRAKKKNFPTSTTMKHEHTQTQKKCASSNGLKEEVNIKQWDVHGLQINSKKMVQDTRSPLLCYICNIRCPSKDNLDAHLKGKKHLTRIQELADFVEGLSSLWGILCGDDDNDDCFLDRCASICAIESKSNSDTRKLVAYWVLYSLISLFEHAFMKLLEWLPFWPTMKLIIMCRLMIPHFSSALYFYELLVQPCLSLEPQFVITLFNEWKERYLKRDEFPAEAERYQKQNESKASKELRSSESKFIEHNMEPEEIKAVEVTEKNEITAIERSKFIEHNIEPEEIKAVEVTEKNEVTAIERDTPIESTLVQTKKSTVMLTDMKERDTTKSIPDFMEVQKEWTCAICQVTTQSETTLYSHLQGKRHKATCEELKLITRAKNKGFPTSTPKKHEHLKQTKKKCASSNGLKEGNIKQRDVHGLQKNSKKVVQNTYSPLWCYICNLGCTSKVNLESHRKGKKHLTRIQELAGLVGGQHA